MIEYGNPNSDIILIQPVDDHSIGLIGNEIDLIHKYTNKEFKLVAVKVSDWNKELSPWTAPAVFGREEFGNGASDTLNKILPICGDKTKRYYVGGYSLAGLFALWASCQTDTFEGVAAASPSMWFPGFTDYLKDNKPKCSRIYLSLGDKESKTRNQVMAKVGDNILRQEGIFRNSGVECKFEWNPGNHFRDADKRTAKGMAWMLK